MTKFYVTTTEISKGLDISTYKARVVFNQIKNEAFRTNTPLIDRTTVPTMLLCKYLKISTDHFMNNLEESNDI